MTARLKTPSAALVQLEAQDMTYQPVAIKIERLYSDLYAAGQWPPTLVKGTGRNPNSSGYPTELVSDVSNVS